MRSILLPFVQHIDLLFVCYYFCFQHGFECVDVPGRAFSDQRHSPKGSRPQNTDVFQIRKIELQGVFDCFVG